MKLPSLAFSGNASAVFRFTCSLTLVSGIGDTELESLEHARLKQKMYELVIIFFTTTKIPESLNQLITLHYKEEEPSITYSIMSL